MTWAVPPIRMRGGASMVLQVQGPVSRTWTSRTGSFGKVTSRISSVKSLAWLLPATMEAAEGVVDEARRVEEALRSSGEGRPYGGWWLGGVVGRKARRKAFEAARRSIVGIIVASSSREGSGTRPGGRIYMPCAMCLW